MTKKLHIPGIYRHYKGDLYLVEDIIYHSETGEKMVAYRALYGDNKLWCRPYDMFFDEVNQNGQKYRFEIQAIPSRTRPKREKQIPPKTQKPPKTTTSTIDKP